MNVILDRINAISTIFTFLAFIFFFTVTLVETLNHLIGAGAILLALFGLIAIATDRNKE